VNWDVGVDRGNDRFGLGIVIRDSDGRFVAARATSRNGCVDPTSGEAMASFQAAKLCQELGLQNVILEGDAEVVVKGVNSKERIWTRYGHIIEGTRTVLQTIPNWTCQHVNRKADTAAHPMAHLAIKTVIDRTWVGDLFSVVNAIDAGMKKNLFSVVNVVDAGNYVLFGSKDVKFLQNIRILDVDVVHTGKRIKDLFVLASTVSYVDKMSTNDGASIWHARLGHLSMDKLKAMVLKNLVKGLPMLTTLGSDEVCEGCQYGNAHRLPFDKSFSRCKSPLELIHGDLMGPCTTPSYSGSLYMLVLVDDYTQFTWVYFMKEKSEVFFRFKEFKATVESMLNKKIKRFRTDNGGEFTSINFNKFCQEQGIRRELSCAYTPQQNGVAERKIRHLVETCRS
jgi:ribonuclease HI